MNIFLEFIWILPLTSLIFLRCIIVWSLEQFCAVLWWFCWALFLIKGTLWKIKSSLCLLKYYKFNKMMAGLTFKPTSSFSSFFLQNIKKKMNRQKTKMTNPRMIPVTALTTTSLVSRAIKFVKIFYIFKYLNTWTLIWRCVVSSICNAPITTSFSTTLQKIFVTIQVQFQSLIPKTNSKVQSPKSSNFDSRLK